MVSNRAFIFHIYIPWGKTLSLVPKPLSSVKVRYQGHSFREKKNGSCSCISVSQTEIVKARIYIY